MLFVELAAFTKRLFDILDDSSYTELQVYLARFPAAGKLIRNSHGLRKIRWAAKGHGKRGGARVIYYWRTSEGQIILARIYTKNESEDLSPGELKLIKREIGI